MDGVLVKAIEIFTLVTGVIYVVLEIRQKNFMWIVGLATSLAAMWMFFRSGLYASFGLNCYYFAMSVWGLFQWRKDAAKLTTDRCAEGTARLAEGGVAGECQEDKPVGGDRIHLTRLSPLVAVLCCVAFVAGFLLLRLGMDLLGDSQSGLDSAVAVLSAVATFMLARSYISQWLVWIVADGLSTYLCIAGGMYWMSALYFVYAASAVYGYVYWRRHGEYVGENSENG